jgi:hypothetical protein
VEKRRCRPKQKNKKNQQKNRQDSLRTLEPETKSRPLKKLIQTGPNKSLIPTRIKAGLILAKPSGRAA